MSGKYLRDTYHHGVISTQRTKTYAVGKAVASSLFSTCPAFERMVDRRRASSRLLVVPDKIRVSWRSLAMGDLNVVCFMTTAHLQFIAPT